MVHSMRFAHINQLNTMPAIVGGNRTGRTLLCAAVGVTQQSQRTVCTRNLRESQSDILQEHLRTRNPGRLEIGKQTGEGCDMF